MSTHDTDPDNGVNNASRAWGYDSEDDQEVRREPRRGRVRRNINGFLGAAFNRVAHIGANKFVSSAATMGTAAAIGMGAKAATAVCIAGVASPIFAAVAGGLLAGAAVGTFRSYMRGDLNIRSMDGIKKIGLQAGLGALTGGFFASELPETIYNNTPDFIKPVQDYVSSLYQTEYYMNNIRPYDYATPTVTALGEGMYWAGNSAFNGIKDLSRYLLTNNEENCTSIGAFFQNLFANNGEGDGASASASASANVQTDGTGSANADAAANVQTDGTGSANANAAANVQTDGTGSANADAAANVQTDGTGSADTDTGNTDAASSQETLDLRARLEALAARLDALQEQNNALREQNIKLEQIIEEQKQQCTANAEAEARASSRAIAEAEARCTATGTGGADSDTSSGHKPPPALTQAAQLPAAPSAPAPTPALVLPFPYIPQVDMTPPVIEILQSASHEVKPCENLWKIVKNHYGLTSNAEILRMVDEVGSINGLSNLNVVRPGQVITLPHIDTFNDDYRLQHDWTKLQAETQANIAAREARQALAANLQETAARLNGGNITPLASTGGNGTVTCSDNFIRTTARTLRPGDFVPCGSVTDAIRATASRFTPALAA